VTHENNNIKSGKWSKELSKRHGKQGNIRKKKQKREMDKK
jgi:hypothetical protein